MSKYTPGPWEVALGGNFVEVWEKGKYKDAPSLSRKHGAIAEIKLDYPHNPEEHIADANLICAAPDLLEALEVFIEWGTKKQTSWTDFIEVLDKARAAINKAEGGKNV
jgi:hypothetical protein